ncbi:MAG: helix-turn-helix domain-containing protein [Clostridia bacterium]|nr:helix-turn-helix domain-containing protein [Clostridia bacterium]
MKRIKELRKENGVTQKEIADYLNIKQNTYSQYENGQRQVPIEILARLADYYEVSVDYIIGRTDI